MGICKIIASAVRMKDGKVFTGKRHNHAIEAAYNAGYRDQLDLEQGFVTSTGEYVDREEAAKIAFQSKQIKKQVKILYSEDLWSNHKD
jgi:hypothetical protein